MKRLKAAVFDLDGVIANTSIFHFKAWKKLAGEIGIDLEDSFEPRLKGISRIGSLELILQHGNRSYSLAEKEELAGRKNKYYLELVGTITEKNLLPGVIDCFRTIKARGIKMALASASRNAFTVLDLLKITGYFDFIADPSSVEKNKPDPEIFIKAAGGVGASPLECIGIEDSEAGIQAINACGMFSVGICSNSILKEARICIKDLTELNLEEVQKAWDSLFISSYK
jgi:beta-phosphoglucomutase